MTSEKDGSNNKKKFRNMLRFKKINWRTFGIVGGVGLVSVYVFKKMTEKKVVTGEVPRPSTFDNLPSRQEQIKAFTEKDYDMLVIGGGATGCGVALDAVSRGLKVALVEKFDFASGTSSRSTKLIHGGVRYLQNAIMTANYEQYQLVKEALSERANLLQIAPHLSFPLPIMLPVYEWWQVPYFWMGIKMYDFVSGSKKLKSSYLLSKKAALQKFPMLKEDKLKAAIVYYDGSHNDARMNLSIALTAARLGANICNYCEVEELLTRPMDCRDIKPGLKDVPEHDVVDGALVLDRQSGKRFAIRAKSVVNATGPFTDSIRTMDDPDIENICQPSSGVHIILPGYYSPDAMGLLDPSTSDGRVIFFLPWQNLTIAGTTDSPATVTHNPAPTEKDIQFILHEIRSYLGKDVQVRRGDVQSAWSGLRPLVTNPNSADTKSLSRNHVVEVSKNHLITIAGGKWTTYRSMAKDAVDQAVDTCMLKPKYDSRTLGLRLEGGHQWSPNHFIRLAQTYGLETDVAKHLSETYGDRADEVAQLAAVTGKRHPIVGKRLAEEFPYIEAEVKYAVREYACSAADVLSLRTRLAFLSYQAAEEALPRVLDIMGEELGWGEERLAQERERAMKMIAVDMGKNSKKISTSSINLNSGEVEQYTARFHAVDQDKKGFITRVDISRLLQELEIAMKDDVLQQLINEVDLNNNGKVELDEFLMVMSDIKHGDVRTNPLTEILKSDHIRSPTCDTSGGGV